MMVLAANVVISKGWRPESLTVFVLDLRIG